MMRRAEWRPLSNDPKSQAGWALRAAGSSAFLNEAAWTFVVVALVLFIHGFPLGLLALILATGAGLGARRTKRDDFTAVLTLPLPPETFLVRATFRYQRATTGEDAGAASFVDGWLHFDGLRTSFSVAAGDARTEIDPDARDVRLRLFSDQEVWLVADVSAEAAAFASHVRSWALARETASGAATLPPLAVLPLARARLLLSAIFSSIALGLVLTLWGFTLTGNAFSLLVSVLPMLGLFAIRMVPADAQRAADREAARELPVPRPSCALVPPP